MHYKQILESQVNVLSCTQLKVLRCTCVEKSFLFLARVLLFFTYAFQLHREYLSITQFNMTERSMPFHSRKGKASIPCEQQLNHF